MTFTGTYAEQHVYSWSVVTYLYLYDGNSYVISIEQANNWTNFQSSNERNYHPCKVGNLLFVKHCELDILLDSHDD